jgi:hypothetical protein
LAAWLFFSFYEREKEAYTATKRKAQLRSDITYTIPNAFAMTNINTTVHSICLLRKSTTKIYIPVFQAAVTNFSIVQGDPNSAGKADKRRIEKRMGSA